MDDKWTRLVGVMLSNAIDKEALADYFHKLGVAAEIVWNPKTAYMVTLRVATDGERVALLRLGATEFEDGPTLQELADGLASEFNAEVRLGEARADCWQGKDADQMDVQEETACDLAAIRTVEIGTLPATAVPILAAVEGFDFAELELVEGKRALLAEVPPSRPEASFGDLPVVILRMEGGSLKAALLTDNDPDSVRMYDWGLQRLFVVGEAGPDKPAPKFVQRVVGSRQTIEAIHDAVPGIDVEGACNAATHQGLRAVREFVAALGLPRDVAEFLLGSLQLSDVVGARVSRVSSMRSAIGRSVEKTLEGEGGPVPLWDGYTNLTMKRPYLMQILRSLEAVSGALLLALSISRSDLKPWVKRLGIVGGSFVLADSAIQTMLSRYVFSLHYRREADKNRQRYRN